MWHGLDRLRWYGLLSRLYGLLRSNCRLSSCVIGEGELVRGKVTGAGSRDGVNGTGGGSGSSEGESSIGGRPCSSTAFFWSLERLLCL